MAYDREDVYRGVDGRDVVLVEADDTTRLGVREGELLVLKSVPVQVERAATQALGAHAGLVHAEASA